MDAARHWASGGRPEQTELRTEMRLFGASDEDVERVLGQIGGGAEHATELEVWPSNLVTVETFRALSTQWRVAPMGGRIGLDYAAITPTVLAGLRVRKRQWPKVFEGLRVMEAVALTVFSEQAERTSATARRRGTR